MLRFLKAGGQTADINRKTKNKPILKIEAAEAWSMSMFFKLHQTPPTCDRAHRGPDSMAE